MTTTLTDRTGFTVRCPNGVTTWLATIDDARNFAEWGHACLAADRHQITDRTNTKETTAMTATYKTTGRLTNPVTDLDAARAYLDTETTNGYPMVNFLVGPFGVPELAGVVHDVRWDLTSEDRWVVTTITTRLLTDAERELISSWISGQNSDGLGEGFEQQAFAEPDGYDAWGDYDDDDEDPSFASFDWQDNPCTLELARVTEAVTS